MNTQYVFLLSEVGCYGCRVYEVNKQRCYRQRDMMRKLLKHGGVAMCEEFTDYIRANTIVFKVSRILYFREVDVLKYMGKYPHE